MSGGKGTSLSFILFIAMSIVILGVSGIPWKIGPKSGELGTSADHGVTVAWYELEAGDRIWYEYEASVTCWFVITTDPLNPEVEEKLNLSGTKNSGLFECQTNDRYYLRVDFFEIPQDGIATIDYESYALDDASVIMMAVKPIASAFLTILLVLLVYKSYRRSYRADSSTASGESRSFWQYFASKIGNWVAIVAGGVIVTAASVIDSLNPATDLAELMLFWLFYFGRFTIFFGVFLGLYITWSEYKARALR